MSVAVDEKEAIIVALDVVDEKNDFHHVEPMIENVKETPGYKPTILLVDEGYFSYHNVIFLLDEEIDSHMPDNFYEVENLLFGITLVKYPYFGIKSSEFLKLDEY